MSVKQGKTREATDMECWLFSVGNIANNIVFMFISLYIMFYYTNILGISAAKAGLIFMVARLVDAFTDPLMGMIVDRTNSKYGKFRPYILLGAPFVGITFVLLFVTPDVSMGGKIIYAYVTYILYSLAWTLVQTPQLALPIIMSNDIARRTKIQAIFQTVGAVATMAVTSWVLPLIDRLGGQDDQAAWAKVAIGAAIIATILFILSAMSVRKLDVYKEAEASQKANVTFKESLSIIMKNRALLMVLITFGTDQFANQIATALRIYFFTFNMNGRVDLITYLGYVSLITAIIALFVIHPIAKHMGKRLSITICEIICAFGSLLLLFSGNNVTLVMIAFVINLGFFSLTGMLSRAAVLDAANYSYVKTGVDIGALTSSTLTFVNKCAQALSMVFAGYLLTATGYNAALSQQSDGTLRAILYLIALVPLVSYAISVIAMYFYPMNRKGEIEVQEKLEKMHAGEAEIIGAEA